MTAGLSSEARSYDLGPADELIARHHHLDFPYSCQFGLSDLLIQEGVFCPTLTRVSPLLLREVQYRPGEVVLDAFTGSGAFAIDAALHGAARVVAFDNDPTAVRCARLNTKRNMVGHVVDVRLGDAQQSLRFGESFDLIIANPPLLPGDASGDHLRRSIFDPGLRATTDFVRRVPTLLRPSGRCYLVTSDVIDRMGIDIDQLCADQGMTATLQAKEGYDHETYRVHLMRRD